MSKYYERLYFTTCTINRWKHVMKTDERKIIITDSLQFLFKEGSIQVFAFVIMPNHIHLVWQIKEDIRLSLVQQRLLKFTAYKIKDAMRKDGESIAAFHSGRRDRNFQVWQDRSLSKRMITHRIACQKINYIHGNPLQKQWNLIEKAEDYRFSSASFYETGETEWKFLKHIDEL